MAENTFTAVDKGAIESLVSKTKANLGKRMPRIGLGGTATGITWGKYKDIHDSASSSVSAVGEWNTTTKNAAGTVTNPDDIARVALFATKDANGKFTDMNLQVGGKLYQGGNKAVLDESWTTDISASIAGTSAKSDAMVVVSLMNSGSTGARYDLNNIVGEVGPEWYNWKKDGETYANASGESVLAPVPLDVKYYWTRDNADAVSDTYYYDAKLECGKLYAYCSVADNLTMLNRRYGYSYTSAADVKLYAESSTIDCDRSYYWDSGCINAVSPTYYSNGKLSPTMLWSYCSDWNANKDVIRTLSGSEYASASDIKLYYSEDETVKSIMYGATMSSPAVNFGTVMSTLTVTYVRYPEHVPEADCECLMEVVAEHTYPFCTQIVWPIGRTYRYERTVTAYDSKGTESKEDDVITWSPWATMATDGSSSSCTGNAASASTAQAGSVLEATINSKVEIAPVEIGTDGSKFTILSAISELWDTPDSTGDETVVAGHALIPYARWYISPEHMDNWDDRPATVSEETDSTGAVVIAQYTGGAFRVDAYIGAVSANWVVYVTKESTKINPRDAGDGNPYWTSVDTVCRVSSGSVSMLKIDSGVLSVVTGNDYTWNIRTNSALNYKDTESGADKNISTQFSAVTTAFDGKIDAMNSTIDALKTDSTAVGTTTTFSEGVTHYYMYDDDATMTITVSVMRSGHSYAIHAVSGGACIKNNTASAVKVYGSRVMGWEAQTVESGGEFMTHPSGATEPSTVWVMVDKTSSDTEWKVYLG